MRQEYPILRSLEIIETCIAEKLTVESIAGSVYFSKDHYQRLFRAFVGDSVMEYVTRRRLTLAGKALLETGKPVIDVAQEFGYDSREGFTRSFKAYMGVSPNKYRKHGLTAISQNIAKGRSIMTYSKTTDEILRELNSFVAQSKEASAVMRKFGISEYPAYSMFWGRIADRIDALADTLQGQLGGIGSIAERPDEITSRFSIVRNIDDIAFEMNMIGFNARLMVARSLPEYAAPQEPLAQTCLDLARAATIKAQKVMGFLNELATLIFADMRNLTVKKLDIAIGMGRKAVEAIAGYGYIKGELANLVNELTSRAPEDQSALWLDGCLLRLNIILSASQLQDVPRHPSDAAMFEDISAFAESLRDTVDFYETLPRPDQRGTMERSDRKFLQDITFQQNIMLFYTKGEIEKMKDIPDKAQKAAFQTICERIDSAIHFTHAVTDKTACKEIAGKMRLIAADMRAEAEKLREHGGAIRFLSMEYEGLADAVMRCAG